MPNLPTIEILSQEHFDRIVDIFPGDTAAEKIQAYKNWHVNRLIDLVATVESERALLAVKENLPNRPPEPNFI